MSNFQIDPQKKVYLKRLYFENGNAYHPGWYEPNYLPSGCLVEGLVSQQGLSVAEKPNYQNAMVKQEVSLAADSQASQKATFEGEKPIVEIPKNKKIKINQATVEQLSGLPNIGIATANKIVESRDKSAFTDLEDLKKRIELNRGNWDELSERLIFTKP